MSVNYSNAPGKLVREVDEFSGNNLKRRVDLQIIFEETLNKGKDKLLEELAFTAKYIQGLIRILKDGSKNPDVNSLDHVKNDLTSNMKKIVVQLKEAITGTDGSTKQYFERTYFELSQQGFMNLNDLLSDLEWTKKYLNDQKRKTQN
ncbi:MAG: hypothetical protein R6W90_00185 [Ignavibacteriaceae bacterium]